MYAGRIVETAPTKSLIESAAHPYARALINCIPRLATCKTNGQPASTTNTVSRKQRAKLPVIPGSPPILYDPPEGCSFAPRCPKADSACASMPALVDLAGGRSVCCHHIDGGAH
jgi:peptide/nickel transport system ATP-binding protein